MQTTTKRPEALVDVTCDLIGTDEREVFVRSSSGAVALPLALVDVSLGPADGRCVVSLPEWLALEAGLH